MKRCPFCAEEIQDAAVKCKHCGSSVPGSGEAGAVSPGVPLGLDASFEPDFGAGMVLSGRYEVREFLGRGAMGEVYAAHDRKLQREVALKVLPRELTRDVRWQAVYVREARHALELSHPHVARVYDLQEDEGRKATFLVMERLRGFALDAVIAARGRLPWAEVLRVVEEASEGLAYVHKRGLLHGDLKPSNVFLEGLAAPEEALAEGRGQVKLVDFGLSVDLQNSLSRVRAATPSGTLLYMAPERLTPGAEVTGKADLYGLGVMAYEMLTGKAPFEGPPELVIHHHEYSAPPRPDEALCPGEAWELVQALLSKDPVKRPASVEAFLGERHRAQSDRLDTEEVERKQKEEAAAEKTKAQGSHRGGDTWVNPRDGLTYVWIPPGSFQMGAVSGDSDADGNEKPRHSVTISQGFWMGKTEVTVGAFRRFVEATGYRTEGEREGWGYTYQGGNWSKTNGANWRNPGFSQGEDHPVVLVSWNDAKAYCDWVGGRLPTEAEWEYAARAGTDSVYSWGDSMDGAYAWYTGNSGGQAHPVGQKQANAWGLFDMLGNVWEWCLDWYGDSYYGSSPGTDPTGPGSGQYRVLRGGSWIYYPLFLRASTRNGGNPDARNDGNGFRSVVPTR